ncbi:hypothetical protein SAMD00019534_049330 [Acytostelium subglobosum LB1]|uniref:hypothetical protein n=1 Tax=Acytostelium subglobosum LB1 TaxID=1410327 RepID=UPI000644902D|nr:hypothetical protein SAMD00019534_049330 [Acytostelium subglobosum LB1]GAM21758.1 hypothetical protein SAMD00019534_049330 [Acytostelium subglobosum LB1]|eukprot:XP_012754858.1 hypothetical protein SAMD00019534_049330 [Acytostelium subglobosum LB1]
MVWEGDGPYGGRKMVASKDIPKGTVVLRVAPFASSLQADQGAKLCNMCYQDIRYLNEVITCPKVKSKICIESHNDKITKQEHEVECKLVSVNKDTQAQMVYRAVNRALQNKNGTANKQNTPRKWREDDLPFIYDTLEDLERLSFWENIYATPERSAHGTKEAKSIIGTINTLKGSSYLKPLDETFIQDLCTLTNIHPIIDFTNFDQGQGIYPSAALINNGCVPNTIFYTDNHCMLVYHSNRAIKEGEEITGNFSYPLLPTVDRRRTLQYHGFIYCTCDHCKALEDNEYQCPKCGHALNKSYLRTWEPQPSIDFDGQVYVCSKGQATMATIYKVLEVYMEEECAKPREDTILRRYFQPISALWMRYQRDLNYSHMTNNFSKTMYGIKLLKQYYETVLGNNVKDIIPFNYSQCFITTIRAMEHGKKNAKELKEVKRQFRQHLEDTIRISNHSCLELFELCFGE